MAFWPLDIVDLILLVDDLSLLQEFLLTNATTTFPYFLHFTSELHEAQRELHTSWIIDSRVSKLFMYYFLYLLICQSNHWTTFKHAFALFYGTLSVVIQLYLLCNEVVSLLRTNMQRI